MPSGPLRLLVLRLLVLVCVAFAGADVRAQTLEPEPMPLAEGLARTAPTTVPAPAPVPVPVSALARPRERHPIRASLEEVLFVGLGATWYFLDDANRFDWDRPPLRDRFTHAAVRLDNNTLAINYLWHPLSGAAYYGYPRANGLDVGTSFALGLGACLLWEYGLEFREKVSINDLVTTPVTGVALGEFLSRLAFYLNRAPGGGTRAHRVAGYLLGPTQAIHDAMDRLPPVDPNAVRDELGYDASITHRFDVGYGLGLASLPSGAALVHEASIEGRLVAIEDYLSVGRHLDFFADANASRLRMALRQGQGVFGTTIDADAMILGLRLTDVRVDPSGARRGVGFLFGTSVGYVYRRDSYAGYDDRLGTTRLPGLAVDLDVVHPRLRFYVSARFQGELAGTSSLAFPEWRDVNPSVRTKTILEREHYYYALGYSHHLESRLETRFVTLRGSFDVARYDSIEGWDRSQEVVEYDVRAKDRVRDTDVGIRLTPWVRPRVYAELAFHERYRRSVVETFVRELRLHRGEVRLGVSF